MGVKLSQTQDQRQGSHLWHAIPKRSCYNYVKTRFPSQRLECCVNCERPFKKALTSSSTLSCLSWRFPVREMIKGQISCNLSLIHVVKGSETSSSISKHYRVSVHSIAAANKNISDAADLVFEAQLLNIPASASADTKAVTKDGLLSFDEQQRTQVHQKPYMMLTKHRFPHAKSSGYFIVMFLLVAFCIRCITGALRARVGKELGRRQVSDEPKRRMRWRNVLRDTEGKDDLDLESMPNLKSTSSDQDQHSSEDVPHEYDNLKHDYQKFLSECGITESGYWRGGSTQ